MSVYFISDLHIGHRGIPKYRTQFKHVDEHDEWIVKQWNSRGFNKKDIIIILGDIIFDKSKFWMLNELKGQKWALLGNHDILTPYEVYHFFDKHMHFEKRYGFWLSHCPIHPDELRGKKNIHGHVHNKTIPDDRYISVCVEACNGVPVPLDEIRAANPFPK